MPSRDLVKQNAALKIQISDLERRIVLLETELRVTRAWQQNSNAPRPVVFVDPMQGHDNAALSRHLHGHKEMYEPVRALPPTYPVMAVPI